MSFLLIYLVDIFIKRKLEITSIFKKFYGLLEMRLKLKSKLYFVRDEYVTLWEYSHKHEISHFTTPLSKIKWY